jgi:hypothetical protein
VHRDPGARPGTQQAKRVSENLGQLIAAHSEYDDKVSYLGGGGQ